MSEVKAVLKRIQHLNPISVMARNLRNYLIIRFSRFPTNLPYLNEAWLIVSGHLNLLGGYSCTLLRSNKLKEGVLKPGNRLIQSARSAFRVIHQHQ